MTISSALKRMLCCALIGWAAGSSQADVLYSNDFSSVGATPTADSWVHDTTAIDTYGTYSDWPPAPVDIAMKAYGAWSHALTSNSVADSIITITMVLENEGANSGANGGFGLSAHAANAETQFTPSGPRMMWVAPWTGSGNGDIGTFTLTGPTAGGSVAASCPAGPSEVNDYWRRAKFTMEVNTRTGIAQGYYDDGLLHQVITNFDMTGSLTAPQFNALFANGGMKHFGGKFAEGGSKSWIDDVSITSAPAAPDENALLYANAFSSVGATPIADGWVRDVTCSDANGTFSAWNPTPTDMAMLAYGAWSHPLTSNSVANSTITIAMTLENQGANSGANGGFGLSANAANSGGQFTASGPRMMWTAPWTGSGDGDIGTFTLTGPIAGGSVAVSNTVPSNFNDYWRRVNVIMEINTKTGVAQGYYNDGTLHQVITNFDMTGSLSASQFNALFANGDMKYFGGRFAGPAARSWIDNVSVSYVPIQPSGTVLVLH